MAPKPGTPLRGKALRIHTVFLLLIGIWLNGCSVFRNTAVDRHVALSRDLTLQGLEANYQQSTDNAEKLFTSAVHSDPKNVEARMHLAEMYRQRNALDAAIEQLEECRRIAPDNQLVLTKLGSCYMEVNQPDRAVALANESLRGDKSSVDAWTLKAQAEWKVGKRKDALSNYLRALRIQPDNQEVRTQVAILYQELGMPTRALSTLDKIASDYDEIKVPDHILFQQALALRKLNRSDEAISRLETGFRRNDFSSQLAELYVSLLIDQKRTQEAFDALRLAFNRFPDNPSLQFQKNRIPSPVDRAQMASQNDRPIR